jgi:hypothetical protein
MSRWVVVLSVIVMLMAATVAHAQTPAPGNGTITGGTPTVSACGTAPSVVGNDFVGTITIGAGNNVYLCTLTFSTTLSAAPVCIGVGILYGNPFAGAVESPTSSAVTFNLGVNRSAGTLYYHCLIPG